MSVGWRNPISQRRSAWPGSGDLLRDTDRHAPLPRTKGSSHVTKLSRRVILAASAAGSVATVAATAKAAATFGNPDLPPQGAINANPKSLTDPGPQNPALANNLPSFL